MKHQAPPPAAFGAPVIIETLHVSAPAVSSGGPLNNLDWNNISSLKKSAEGVTGINFVGFSDGKDVVLKSGPLDREIYFDTLSKKMGLATPERRFAADTTSEGTAIHDATGAGGKMMIMSRVDGPNITNMTGTEWKETFCGEGDTLTPQGESHLKDLGRVLAFDWLVNNWDRGPSGYSLDGGGLETCLRGKGDPIDPKSGNSGNLMFDRTHQKFVAIDNGAPLVFDPAEYKLPDIAKDFFSGLSEVLAKNAEPGAESKTTEGKMLQRAIDSSGGDVAGRAGILPI